METRKCHNVVEHLRRAVERFGERDALVFDSADGRSERITFARLWDRADRIGRGLHRAGLEPGQRAIIMVPMSIDLYVTLLAVLKIGGVGVFVDPWIGRPRLAAVAPVISPTAYIGVAGSHLLRLSTATLRRIPITVTTGRRLFRVPARSTIWELESSSGDGNVYCVNRDDSALITFTGGSSGIPKGADRTHGFLSAQHAALQHEFPYGDDDVDMPMFPVFTLNNLAAGITSVVPAMDFRRVSRVDGETIVAQMHRHGVTACTASPRFLDRVATYLREHPEHRPRLRRILTGGAPVADRQLESWRRALPDTRIVVVYGSTEAEPVAHVDADERLSITNELHPKTPGYCVGRHTPLLDTRLIRIERSPVELGPGNWDDWLVETGEVGELVVAGDHVCRGYYNNLDAARENKIVDADGRVWHRMGDLGYFDAQDRFWLVGRLHSTIVRDDRAVHPQLVEQAARGDDTRIAAVAAVGRDDPAMGQRVTVVVETPSKPYADVEADVRSRLANAALPCDDLIVRAERLPVDPRHNAKIDYRRLREQLEACSRRFE